MKKGQRSFSSKNKFNIDWKLFVILIVILCLIVVGVLVFKKKEEIVLNPISYTKCKNSGDPSGLVACYDYIDSKDRFRIYPYQDGSYSAKSYNFDSGIIEHFTCTAKSSSLYGINKDPYASCLSPHDSNAVQITWGSYTECIEKDKIPIKGLIGSDGKCSNFIPSVVLTEISEETGKPDEHYCSYDESRNKVTVIIKENGIYDNSQVISKINQYFTSVKSHLNIDNAGVKKFKGNSIPELDLFIENLVKEEYIGYIILVGSDLPVVKSTDTFPLSLDIGTLNDQYEFVGRIRNSAENVNCVDVAISSVFAPESYTDEEKSNFIVSVFSNFVQYHNNPESTYSKYNGILAIDWDNSLSEGIGFPVGGGLNPVNYNDYRRIYYYPTTYNLNTEFNNIHNNLKNKLLFIYNVHGVPSAVGIGLSEPVSTTEINSETIFTDLEEMSSFEKINGQPSLFIQIFSACDQDVLDQDSTDIFCCWPQEWLKTKAWTVYTVFGSPNHNNFNKFLYDEKVVGKALRKTYHNQNMVYGDILGTFP